MFWTGIIRDEFIGPVIVHEDVKINPKSYCDFIYAGLLDWLKNLILKRRLKTIFMHHNAQLHCCEDPTEFLYLLSFKKDTLMDWPACFFNLNPIKNLWVIIKEVFTTMESSI